MANAWGVGVLKLLFCVSVREIIPVPLCFDSPMVFRKVRCE